MGDGCPKPQRLDRDLARLGLLAIPKSKEARGQGLQEGHEIQEANSVTTAKKLVVLLNLF